MTGLPPPRKKKTRKKKTKAAPPPEPVMEPKAQPGDTIEVMKSKTNNVFTCLWKADDVPGFCRDVYGPNYVASLMGGVRRNVPRGLLHVLCDDHYYDILNDDPRFNSVRLEKFYGDNCGGWSQVFEVVRSNLRPRMGKRHIWVGLDTIFMSNAQWLFDWDESIVGLPRDPLYPHKACNAVWTWNYEGAAFVWDAYEVAKKDGMKDYLLFDRPSEMQLLRFLCKSGGWKPLENNPKKLLSYKAHVLQGVNPWKTHATMVYFHGKPKPSDLPPKNRIRLEWMRP